MITLLIHSLEAVYLDASMIVSLRSRGYAIVDNFLSGDTCGRVLADVLALERANLFHECGLGRENVVDPRIRRSRMLDLYNSEGRVHSNAFGCADTRFELCQAVAGLRDALSTAGAVDLAPFETETHYLSYPVGGRYTRHRDVATRREDRGWQRLGGMSRYPED